MKSFNRIYYSNFTKMSQNKVARKQNAEKSTLKYSLHMELRFLTSLLVGSQGSVLSIKVISSLLVRPLGHS